jgi:uncharacterized membrane protein (UPF0127 family)
VFLPDGGVRPQPEPGQRLDQVLERAAGTASGRRWLGRAVLAVLVAGLLGFLTQGANRPADPHLEPASGIAGFGEVSFRITPPPGSGFSAGRYCALLAETADQRARGLMGRRDLAGHDAMVFRFGVDTNSTFFVRSVPVALSVAWFDAAGRFVSSADMAPCPDRDGCPLYVAPRPYRVALQVLQGGLLRLGVGPGSVIRVGGPCQS